MWVCGIFSGSWVTVTWERTHLRTWRTSCSSTWLITLWGRCLPVYQVTLSSFSWIRTELMTSQSKYTEHRQPRGWWKLAGTRCRHFYSKTVTGGEFLLLLLCTVIVLCRDYFEGFTHLAFVRLNFNELSDKGVPKAVFNVSTLLDLQLAHNQLTMVPLFSSHLEHLHLNHNSIESKSSIFYHFFHMWYICRNAI